MNEKYDIETIIEILDKFQFLNNSSVDKNNNHFNCTINRKLPFNEYIKNYISVNDYDFKDTKYYEEIASKITIKDIRNEKLKFFLIEDNDKNKIFPFSCSVANYRSVNLEKIIFAGDIKISDSSFFKFNKCHFYGNVELDEMKKFIFSNCHFYHKLEFNHNFEDGNFKGSVFYKDVNFSGLTFKRINFNNTKFYKVPNFEFTEFSTQISLSKITIPKTKQAIEDIDNIDHIFLTDLEAKYRILKSMAIFSNDYEKELEFFSNELECKRLKLENSKLTINNFLSLFLFQSYKLFSNYGKSIFRPFCCYIIVKILYLLKRGCNCVDVNNYLIFNFNIIDHFLSDTKSKYYEIFLGRAPFEMMISSILIFLIILGIRNKFKIK